MTTETRASRQDARTGTVLGMAAGVSLAAGLVAAVLATVLAGPEAGGGAAVGATLVVAVFGGGSFVVNGVARVLPSAALLVALLTYLLQVVLMGACFLVLSRSGLLDTTLDRRWLAGAVIVGTFVWLATQVVLTTRLRIPAFEPTTVQRPGGRDVQTRSEQ